MSFVTMNFVVFHNHCCMSILCRVTVICVATGCINDCMCGFSYVHQNMNLMRTMTGMSSNNVWLPSRLVWVGMVKYDSV